jgi:hypothetical protein
MEDNFGISSEDVEELWENFYKVGSEPYPGAVEFIHELHRAGFYVIGLSKRDGKLLERGIEDFKCLPLDELHINGGSKGEYLESIKISQADFVGFIDDKTSNIRSVEKRFPLTELFLFSRPWNRSMDIDPSYQRVADYADILEILDSVMKDAEIV